MDGQELTEACIGLRYEKASELCKENGFIYRVESTDGVYHMVTSDIRTDRVTFCVDDDIISYARIK